MTILQEMQTLLNTKGNVRQAIVDKGVDIAENAPFNIYAEKISQITGGKAEYVFENTTEEAAFPRHPYSATNDFTYNSFSEYMASDKDFCCTKNVYDGYNGDVPNVFDGNESTTSATSFFFRFNDKLKVKKLHIVIDSAGYWGGTPIIYGSNDAQHATSTAGNFWTELHNFNGQVGEFTVDLSDAEYQYFYYYVDRINVSKFEVIADVTSISMTLASYNMTPSVKVFADDYMTITTQDWSNGSVIIPSQELICKPVADGGCLADFTDDGSAFNASLYYTSNGYRLAKGSIAGTKVTELSIPVHTTKVG